LRIYIFITMIISAIFLVL